MKTVILDADTVAYNGDVDLKIFNSLGEVEIYNFDEQEKTPDRLKDADCVITNKTVIGKEEIAAAKHLKYIGLFATGYNNIDIPEANKAGITVCNAGSYSTDAVAQHVFALILNRYSRVYEYDNLVKKGLWLKSPTFSPFVLATDEIAGKTLGIVGYGSIGKAVADIALAFKMKVIVYTRTKKEDSRVEFVTFDRLLETADIISPHCPLTEATTKMFNKNAFDKMKDGAFFINTARGGVIDEAALKQALDSGRITAAADVLTFEPMRGDCPLRDAQNFTLTPHVAWAPLTTRKRLVEIVYANLKGFIEGAPQNVVNNPVKENVK